MSKDAEDDEAPMLALAARLAAGVTSAEIQKMLRAIGVSPKPAAKKLGRPKKAIATPPAPARPATPNKLSLSVEEAGAAIGVARSAVYEYIARGDLPSFKLGKRRLILMKDLEAWIAKKAKEGRR
jgi:excisionase family DNA binding protein